VIGQWVERGCLYPSQAWDGFTWTTSSASSGSRSWCNIGSGSQAPKPARPPQRLRSFHACRGGPFGFLLAE
jgi:hypothetical protein